MFTQKRPMINQIQKYIKIKIVFFGRQDIFDWDQHKCNKVRGKQVYKLGINKCKSGYTLWEHN